jgi:hypothetical protein
MSVDARRITGAYHGVLWRWLRHVPLAEKTDG